MQYQYVVVIRDDTLNTPSTCFPSNSRNSIKHLEEQGGTYCWIYDKDGWWVSYAHRDPKTGKVYHPKMFPDGEPRVKYAKMLEEFNRKEKQNA